jgi:hypothetical protein
MSETAPASRIEADNVEIDAIDPEQTSTAAQFTIAGVRASIRVTSAGQRGHNDAVRLAFTISAFAQNDLASKTSSCPKNLCFASAPQATILTVSHPD